MADNNPDPTQPKAPTLEELARAEELAAKKREANKKLYLEQIAKLRKLIHERYFNLVRLMREGAARFNGAAKLERPLAYTETIPVTVRDTSEEADFYVE